MQRAKLLEVLFTSGYCIDCVQFPKERRLVYRRRSPCLRLVRREYLHSAHGMAIVIVATRGRLPCRASYCITWLSVLGKHNLKRYFSERKIQKGRKSGPHQILAILAPRSKQSIALWSCYKFLPALACSTPRVSAAFAGSSTLRAWQRLSGHLLAVGEDKARNAINALSVVTFQSMQQDLQAKAPHGCSHLGLFPACDPTPWIHEA